MRRLLLNSRLLIAAIGIGGLLAFALFVGVVFAVTLAGFGVGGFDILGPVLANVVFGGVPVAIQHPSGLSEFCLGEAVVGVSA